jgi:outer membrane protein assembly factor BamA
MSALFPMRWITRILLIILLMSHVMFAQAPEEAKQQKKKIDKPKFAAIPVPNYNEATGFGLGAIVTLLYPIDREDEISPPSSSTIFGFYAKNKTNALGVAQNFHLKEDKYRFTLALARASINFQYYAENLGGKFIDYNTGSKFGLIKGELQILSHFYLGLKYRYMRSRTTFDIPIDYEPPENTYSGLGPTVSYDTRDNIFNAYTGYFIKLETLFNHSAFGSDRNYSIFEFKANRYLTLKDNHRLALRLFFEVGTGDVPFEDQAIMGRTDLRGYSSGKYRADQKYTIQGEYRWTFYKKFGMVAFAGVGWVADKMSEIRLEDTLPSAGVGLRYMMIPQYRINVGIDFAVGKDDTAFYFRINEAF